VKCFLGVRGIIGRSKCSKLITSVGDPPTILVPAFFNPHLVNEDVPVVVLDGVTGVVLDGVTVVEYDVTAGVVVAAVVVGAAVVEVSFMVIA